MEESDLCIGHSTPSAQHAIRASGVATQPAQSAAFPAISVSVRNTPDNRRLKVTTVRRMLHRVPHVNDGRDTNPWPAASALGDTRSVAIALSSCGSPMVGWLFGTVSATGSCAPLADENLRSSLRLQISRRSWPKTTLPSNRDRAASIHIWSVICGSSAGTRWESTSVFTPAACAIRPASCADV